MTSFRVRCGVCGDFDVSEEAIEDYLESTHETRLTPLRRALLSHLVRKQQVAGSHEFPLVKRDLIESVIRGDVDSPPPPEQAASALRIIGAEVKAMGHPLPRLPEHLYATIGAPNPDGAARLVGDLIRSGLVRGIDASSMNGAAYIEVDLTVAGWEAYASSTVKKRAAPAIIVMKFNNAELDAFVDDVVKPAVLAAGFVVERVCENPRAGQIETAMKEKIAAAPFVLAELTHKNNGAYFEAGYADASGVPVIYMCREAEWREHNDTHFDTNHQETLVWSADRPEEFAERLVVMIRNSVGA